MKNTAIRTCLRALALILAVTMMVTSGSTATALEVINNITALVEQSFTLAPEDGVTVTLSGMMPENGYAEAKPADIEGEDILHAYDITIFYSNGWEFEPCDDSPISVSFKSEDIAEAIDDSDIRLEVEHIADNGETESVELICAEDGEAVFDADSFSIYLIKTHDTNDENLKSRRTYHFLSPNYNQVTIDGHIYYQSASYMFPNKANDLVCTQTITDGESLQEIVLPENNSAGLFYGWYIVHLKDETRGLYTYYWGSEEPQHVPFHEPIEVKETDDTDVYLAPLFGHYRFLTFHQDIEGSDNANTIITRKLITLGEDRRCTLKISDVRAPSTNPNRIIFWGWKYTHRDGDVHSGLPQTEIIRTVSTDDSEIEAYLTIQDTNVISGRQPNEDEIKSMIFDIWPVFKEARWIEFDVGGNGASYRPPQFIMIDEPPTSFNNVPTRPGFSFNGWYYNRGDGNGGTVKTLITDEYASIRTDINTTIDTGVSIEDGRLVMTSEANELIFYADWQIAATAEFHVIVWKQKITDRKGIPDSEKTYDFGGYFPDPETRGATLIGSTSVDPRSTSDYLNFEGSGKGFEDFAETRPEDYHGFHFARTSLVDDGNNNSSNKINPDGSTVVNVYYDRDLMTVTYHYKNESQLPAMPAGGSSATVNGYLYLATDSDGGEQYGLVDGSYVPLRSSSHIESAAFMYSHIYTASEEEDEAMYGVIGGEYVSLTREPVYIWEKTYSYTPTTSNSGEQYGVHNSGLNRVYYNTLRWRTSDSIIGTRYNGTRYTRSSASGEYTGTRFTVSGTSTSDTSAFTPATQYGYGDNGVLYQLTRVTTGYIYTYNGERFDGTRYTRVMDGSNAHTGAIYIKVNGSFVVTENIHESEVYGIRGGVYERLTLHDESLVYEWFTEDGARYTGVRYFRYHKANGTFAYEDIWTGLFGQNFDMYGYEWPTTYRWTEETGGGTGQTLLVGFTTVEPGTYDVQDDYHLYLQGDAATYKMYHCLERLDDTYSQEPEFMSEARLPYSSSTTSFQFSNKFTGFRVASYSTSFSTSGGGTPCSDGSKATLSRSNTYYVYYERIDDLVFEFNHNYNGEVEVVHNIKFERSLIDLDSHDYDPPAREHFTFEGWYEDSSCTQKFNFNSTMPAADKMVYAKWTPVKYRVEVDPNGGEFPLGSGSSTFFNVKYDEPVGQYSNIKRNYVEDVHGDYVYANFQYGKVSTFPGVTKLEAVYRKAFYINKNSINDSYYNNFTVDGKSYSYSRSGMTLDEYKQCIDMNTLYTPTAVGEVNYRLVSWHRVREDGSVEVTPFNFHDHLMGDIKIQARWVEMGKYSLTYNPTMTDTHITGTMSRYNDPLEDDRKYSDKAPVIILQEPTDLRLGDGSPASQYVFRGWRIVDGKTRQPLEDDVFYDPGDIMILDAKFAGPQGVIHMEAYYEKKESTIRRVDVTSLTLDANAGSKGVVNRTGLAGDKYEYADLVNKQIKLEKRNNNFDVDLKDYIKNFSHTDGNLLLGWNTTPDAGNYIPEYYADAVIGVNKNDMPNILYAVWEPMVYLTLKNDTSKDVTFDLSFNYDAAVYKGHTNSMPDEYERELFDSDENVDKVDPGHFSVVLPAGVEVKLVLPEGAGAQYTVTGSYVDNTSAHKTLIVYNSGDRNTTEISYVNSYNPYWTKNGVRQNSTPVSYTTSGTLNVGYDGQLILFSEDNPLTVLEIVSRYYDAENKTWVTSNSSSGPRADIHFSLPGSYSETLLDDGYTTEVNMINSDHTTVTFGIDVNSYDSANYKFIGWYYTDEAAPNDFTVDNIANGFGGQHISGLTVPVDTTIYFALFVPYASGELDIEHSEKADTAGHCADENGLSLRVQYADVDETTYGDRDHAATNYIPPTYMYEQNTEGSVTVTLGAVPHENSVYKATYRDVFVMEPNRSMQTSYSATIPELFSYSDTVKGLKVIKKLDFYSVFSQGYTIEYKYTARDSEKKTYTRVGDADTFEDFGLFIIDNTPYERTLTGDTVWDTQSMEIVSDDNGMNAVLEEKTSIRGKCTVTINTETGYKPTQLVEYGETFTKEQAESFRAPSKNREGLTFDYWDIVNTHTGEHIANCYSHVFTFAVWNDYTITPHYSATPQEITDEGRFITVDYIETSRNQWDGATVDEKIDKLVADMDIAFIDNGKCILDNRDEYDLGVIFEICGSTGSGTIDPSDYEGSWDPEIAKLRVGDVLANPKQSSTYTDTYSGIQTGYYFTKIDICEENISTFNRSEFARSFNTASVKYRVFRLYAYMVTPDGETVLSTPKYFTMYDYAMHEYALDMKKTPAAQSSVAG